MVYKYKNMPIDDKFIDNYDDYNKCKDIFNMKVLFVDTEDNIIEDEIFMNEIINTLTKRNEQIIDGELYPIQWKYKLLTKNEKNFIGNFFSNTIYNDDRIIYMHTKMTFIKLFRKIITPENYRIRFNITRLLKYRE